MGLPYDGVQSRLDPGTGEVQVKAPCLMLGYYKQPELTKEAFTADGYLKTGDRGSIDSSGRLKITGRVKELFKTSKGKYVAPAPIEDRLVMHAAIEACCVTGANLGQPLALAMLNVDAATKSASAEGKAELESSLAAHLDRINEALDPHEQLEKMVVLAEEWTTENGMLTPTLKLRRAAIEQKDGPRVEGWYQEKSDVLWG